MTQDEKLSELAEMFEVSITKITPETLLEELGWDSMAMLSLMALVNSLFGKTISGGEIKGFKTIRDILDIME